MAGRVDRRRGSAACQRRRRAAGEGAAEEGRSAGPGAGDRQREGRCQRDQGKGAPMSTEGTVVGAASGPPGDQQGLQEEIERTREHLGETVEALVAKVDVKARAQDEASRLVGRLKARVIDARQQAAARAVEARRQAGDKTAGPRQQAASVGGSVAEQVRPQAAAVAAGISNVTPEQVKQVAGNVAAT